ncbi:MAG: hypothetical protein J6T29_00840 [Alphaproteobacteria bacterium]|nr:hypothetical protein [Alphaproteobacteria bacterium]
MKKLAFSVFAAALTFGANAADNVETNVATATATQTGGVFDGLYFGLGIAAVDNGVKFEGQIEVEGQTRENKLSEHCTRLAGTVSLGYGRAVKEKAFIGLEAGLDASQNSEFIFGQARINGLTPSAALRFGYVNPVTKSMIYLKGGAAYSKARFRDLKCSKWAPIVALGVEKVCKNLRTRLEAEYRFRSNKSIEVDSKIHKVTNRGAVTLRAMAVYTVKM